MSNNNDNDKENKVKNSLNNETEELKAKLDEYTNNLMRLQADFENYMKRAEKEKQEFSKYASHKLALKLVNLLDDFERTLENINNMENKEVKEGIEMVYKQMQKMLNEEGVKNIEALGKKFDPYMHEVLDIIEGKEDDLVVEELQKGYLMHDKVLRTCKVRVSKAKNYANDDKAKDRDYNIDTEMEAEQNVQS